MNKQASRLDRVPIKTIDMGTRARKEYNNIPTLAEDIKTRGLIHPIAVKEQTNGFFLLLAGGRRLTACKFAGLETIECKIFPVDLTELEIRSIELAENMQREDLTFYEEAELSREILRLQESIHGKKVSTSPDAPGVSTNDVAGMLGVSREKLRQNVKLAETMEQFPDLDWKKMKNRQQALKVQKGIGKMVIRQEAVKRFEKEVSQKPKDLVAKKLADNYVCQDFFEFVKQIPKNSIDLVEIDPPYAIDLGKCKASTNGSNYAFGETGYNEIASSEYPEFLLRTFTECYRVMKENSFLLCWFGPEPWFSIVLQALREARFNVRGMPCLWAKGETGDEGLLEKTSGQTLSPMRHLANSYEMFFYAKKGDPKIEKQGRSNVFGFKPVSPAKKIHPTERPLELMQEILETFAKPGSQILVPFLGSGNTILAAYQAKMNAFGTDLGEIHRESFLARLAETI